MTEQDYGSQVLLEPEQYKTLAQLAGLQGSTISDVAREVVRLGLEALQKQKRMEALERLNQRQLEYHRRHGMYPGDIVAEVRTERQKQIERVMRGEP